MSHTQRWRPVCPKLRRVQELAQAKPMERFTSLAHHLTQEALRRSYNSLDGKAAAGVDGVTKEAYRQNLEENLKSLHERLKSGEYRATPVLRVEIEKPGGGKRPLGIPALEDKIVQGAVVEILNCIYECDFKGFSYGFRPKRSAHQALQALQTVLQKGKVNWVLDMDISKFFDTIDHKELMSIIEHRVKDGRLLRLIGKWLATGAVQEDGRRIRAKRGTPQGGVISPLLANIFLHYVVDSFVHEWRKTESKGEVYIVRYADDVVIAFESKEDAERLLELLEARLREYDLTVNQDKTRLVRFGRHWTGKDGGMKSETFEFLGFAHIAGKSRKGGFLVKRKTSRKRLNRSLKAITEWCKRNCHTPLGYQHKQLSLKVRGHYNYYGVRGNFDALSTFRYKARQRWLHALLRRSQKACKERLYELLDKCFALPTPHITHPEGWFDLSPGYLLGRAGCGKAARPVL
jgi:RNA-directed DNA polymerase